MRKWIKHLIGIITVAALVYYLARHHEQLAALRRLDWTHLAWIYAVALVTEVNRALVFRHLLRRLDTRAGFWDMVLLQQVTVLLNYLPFKAGSLFRANYLKRRYGLAYASYASLIAVLTLLTTIVATAVGVIVVVVVYGLDSPSEQILAGAFATLLVLALVGFLAPLPRPGGPALWQRALRNFLHGRELLSQNRRAAGPALALLLLNFVLSAVRVGIIYHALGLHVHWAGYLVLGVLGFAALYFNLTPGGLGVREIILGAGAVVLGVTLDEGLLAAMADRAVILGWTIVVGGLSLAWVWKNYPETIPRHEEASGEPNGD